MSSLRPIESPRATRLSERTAEWTPLPHRALREIGAVRCRFRLSDFAIEAIDEKVEAVTGIAAGQWQDADFWTKRVEAEDSGALDAAQRAARAGDEVVVAFKAHGDETDLRFVLCGHGTTRPSAARPAVAIDGYLIVDPASCISTLKELRNKLVETTHAVTDRDQGIRDLQQARQDLMKAAQFAVAGELAAGIAHDLRQPLTALQMDLGAMQHLLKQKEPDIPEVLNVLADVLGDELRVEETLQVLQDLVARHEPRREPVELSTLAADVARLVGTEASARRVALELRLAPRMALVVADAALLRQAVLSLVLDAIESAASPDGSTARVIIATREIDPMLVELCVMHPRARSQEDRRWALSVAKSVAEAHQAVLVVDEDPKSGVTVRTMWPTLSQVPAKEKFI